VVVCQSTLTLTCTLLGQDTAPSASEPEAVVTQSGGLRVLEFVAAWDALAPRLKGSRSQGVGRDSSGGTPSGEALRTLLDALKLAVPALQRAGADVSGRSRQARALGVASCLADLGGDATTVAAALLAEAVDAGVLTLDRVTAQLGGTTAALVADCARVRRLPQGGGGTSARGYDDADAERLRTFCLAFHDVRAILVELAARCDALRHADSLPGWARSALALETMQLYAPMAHALAQLTGDLRFELEDRAFEVLFPQSYASLGDWLAGVVPAGQEALSSVSEALHTALTRDGHLSALLGDTGTLDLRSRLKSRYSTMRKLLRQPQRGREAVHDLLGIRVVLTSASGEQAAVQACYRVQELAHSLWPQVEGRTKDYIASPKINGYASLHSTLQLPGGLELELQVRTAAMEAEAEQGSAAHTAYKGGLATDAANSQRLAALIAAAQAVAEHRYGTFLPALPAAQGERQEAQQQHMAGSAPVLDASALDDAVFRAFDVDGDGEITLAELAAVVGELQQHTEGSSADHDNTGSPSSVALAAAELMRLADTDSSGTVTAAEWAAFRRKIGVLQRLPQEDASTSKTLASSINHQQQRDDAAAILLDSAAIGAPIDAASVVADQHAQTVEVLPQTPAAVPPAVDVALPAFKSAEDLLQARAASRLRAMAAVDALVASRDLFSARQLLRTVTSNDPSFSAAWTRWAGLEAEAGRHEQAMALHEAAVAWAPDAGDRSRALLRAAMCAARLPQRDDTARDLFARAAQAAQRSATDGGDEAQAVPVLHAWACFEAKQRGGQARARQLLTDAQRRDPRNVAVLHARGMLEADSDRYLAAARYFQLGLEVEPGNARLLQAWARLDASRGRLHDARRRFAEALNLHPMNTYVCQAWALAELRAGCTSAARSLLQHGCSVDPGSAPLWSAMGQLEERCGDVEAARAAYRTGLDGNPTNCVLLVAAARLERHCGDLGAARKLLDRALLAEPHSAQALLEYAQLEEACGTGPREAERLRLQALASRAPRKGGSKRAPRWKKKTTEEDSGATSSKGNLLGSL